MASHSFAQCGPNIGTKTNAAFQHHIDAVLWVWYVSRSCAVQTHVCRRGPLCLTCNDTQHRTREESMAGGGGRCSIVFSRREAVTNLLMHTKRALLSHVVSCCATSTTTRTHVSIRDQCRSVHGSQMETERIRARDGALRLYICVSTRVCQCVCVCVYVCVCWQRTHVHSLATCASV